MPTGMTSPTCISCQRLSQEVSELKMRVSRLHQIKGDETFLDSLWPDSDSDASPVLVNGATAPVVPVHVTAAEASKTRTDDTVVHCSPPIHRSRIRAGELDDTMPDPRNVAPAGGTCVDGPVSSTPAPWSLVTRGKHGGPPPPCQNQPPTITTSNSFLLLSNIEQFPPMSNADDGSLAPKPAVRSKLSASEQRNSRKRMLQQAVRLGLQSGEIERIERSSPTPTPNGAATPLVPNPGNIIPTLANTWRRPNSKPSQKSTPPPLRRVINKNPPSMQPPSIAIVSDSILRNARVPRAQIHCFPGATIPVLLERLPGVINSFPTSIDKLVVHVGSNDVALRHSEVTKEHFIQMIDILVSSKLCFFISGPIPTLTRGDIYYSKILSFNTWIKRFCTTHGFNFIDNFNLFWCRPTFFNRDMIHPNREGAHALSVNIAFNIRINRPPPPPPPPPPTFLRSSKRNTTQPSGKLGKHIFQNSSIKTKATLEYFFPPLIA